MRGGVRTACALLLVCGAARGVELLVRCEPDRLVRGGQVACSARVEPPLPFVLVSKRAFAGGHRLDDPSEQRFEPGGEARWAGVAVRDTRVEFTVHSGGAELRGEAAFAVEPRRWPRLTLAGEVAPWDFGPDPLFGGWPPRLRLSGADPQVADGTLASFLLTQPSPPVAYADEGPDARWLYVGAPAPQPHGQAWVSRALRPADPFYELQTGGGGPPRPFCGRNDLELLRRRLLQHEGAAASDGPSHFVESRRALERRDLQAELEAQTLFYDDAVLGPTLGQRIEALINAALESMTTDQIDSVDRHNPVGLPCRLRFP